MNQQIHSFKKSSAIFAVVSGIASLIALAGWQLNISAFRQYIPALAGMNQITATYLIFSSAALWLLFKKGSHKSIQDSVRIVSVIISITGAIEIARTLIQNSHPRLFSAGHITDHAISRMTPGTAINAILLSAAIFLTSYKKRKYSQVANCLAFVIVIAAILSLTGHLLGVMDVYAAQRPSMSVASGVTFLLISFSLLLNNHDAGFMRAVTSHAPAGLLAKIAIPGVLVIPIIFGCLQPWLSWKFPLSVELGTTAFAGILMITFCFVIWRLVEMNPKPSLPKIQGLPRQAIGIAAGNDSHGVPR